MAPVGSLWTLPGWRSRKRFLVESRIRANLLCRWHTGRPKAANRCYPASTLKERFRTSRHNFNSYLDKPTSVGFPADSGASSRRRIFEAFLYGIFAHANPKYRRQVKAWESQPYFDDIRAQFDLVLLEYLKALAALANVCRECMKAGGAAQTLP